MAANKYKVQKSQWRKWCDLAQSTFNDLYSYMVNNKTLFVHPAADWVSPKHWRTNCHNAAWMAADAVQSNLKKSGGHAGLWVRTAGGTKKAGK